MDQKVIKVKLVDIYKDLDSLNIPNKEKEIDEMKEKIIELTEDLDSLETTSLERIEKNIDKVNLILPCHQTKPFETEESKIDINKPKRNFVEWIKYYSPFFLLTSFILILILTILLVIK